MILLLDAQIKMKTINHPIKIPCCLRVKAIFNIQLGGGRTFLTPRRPLNITRTQAGLFNGPTEVLGWVIAYFLTPLPIRILRKE
jgi:hypothetical protein